MAPDTAQLVIRLRGGPRPMSVVVNPGKTSGPSDFTAPFGPDDTVRFSGLPPGRARVEISRHAMPPMLALKTIELKGGETAEVEVILDTLVELSGQVTHLGGNKTAVEVIVTMKNGKSVSSTLSASADGSFKFSDVVQGRCTVEVRTFDDARRILYSQALTEVPTVPLDLLVDSQVEVTAAAKPMPVPTGPRPVVAAPAAAPARAVAAVRAAPVAPPAATPVAARPPPPPPSSPRSKPIEVKAPVAAKPVVVAEKPAAKKAPGKKAPAKEAPAKEAPAKKKAGAEKKPALEKKAAAPKKAAAEKKPAAKKKK